MLGLKVTETRRYSPLCGPSAKGFGHSQDLFPVLGENSFSEVVVFHAIFYI